jgi:hypothetical protein
VSEPSDSRATTEIDDWRRTLHFFESAAEHLAALGTEMAGHHVPWTEDALHAHADLAASATTGAETARRNIARLESQGSPPARPGS